MVIHIVFEKPVELHFPIVAHTFNVVAYPLLFVGRQGTFASFILIVYLGSMQIHHLPPIYHHLASPYKRRYFGRMVVDWWIYSKTYYYN